MIFHNYLKTIPIFIGNSKGKHNANDNRYPLPEFNFIAFSKQIKLKFSGRLPLQERR